jgi:hypothetical protein
MNKVILITFLSFFISAVSYSDSKYFSKKDDQLDIIKCQLKTTNLIFSIIYKNKNPGVVFFTSTEKKIGDLLKTVDETTMLHSNIYLEKYEKKLYNSFYINFGGEKIFRFIYLPDEFEKSLKNKSEFYIDLTSVGSNEKELLKNFEDWADIVFKKNYKLSELTDEFFSKEELKKIESYSNSTKKLFEKIVKNNLEPARVLLSCDPPKSYNIKKFN